jgi:class 3 adenylate cyclase/pimeloyl-ACP methyl ester carboxylesterase
VEIPRTRYAWNGDVALAYQVLGEGPTDLVYLQGWSTHLDLGWESPYLSAFLRELAAGRRLILTDRRGWGCSDRFSPTDVPPFEDMTDDLRTVLDATASDRPVIFATVDAAPLAVLFAATYPDRVGGLILCDPTVTFSATDETPWMWTRAGFERWASEVRAEYPLSSWWKGPADHPERDWFERYVRASISPGALIAELDRFGGTDIRPVLPVVSAPTLVLVDPEGDESTQSGRFEATRIAGARLEEIPDETHLNWPHWYGRADGILRSVARFIAEIRDEEARFDRVLATVLFTDIVGSTQRAAALGDHAWRELLERHHAIVRAMLTRYRGVEVDTAGDGFFATFDGPARAVRCAEAILEAVRPLGIEVRAGVHTGEVETIDAKAGGIAVTIGARVGAMAGPSEVLVSQTVKDLVAGSGLTFDDAGEHELKGVPDRWRLYRVMGS